MFNFNVSWFKLIPQFECPLSWTLPLSTQPCLGQQKAPKATLMFSILLLLSTLDACRGLWRGRYVCHFLVFVISDLKEGMGEGLMPARCTVKSGPKPYNIIFWIGGHRKLACSVGWNWRWLTINQSITRVKEYEMLTLLYALLLFFSFFCMNVPQHQWKKEYRMVVFNSLLENVWSGCSLMIVFLVGRSSQIVTIHCSGLNILSSPLAESSQKSMMTRDIINQDLYAVSQMRWENEWRIKSWIFSTRLFCCCCVNSWKSENGPLVRRSVSVYTHVLISTSWSDFLCNDSARIVLINYLFHNFLTNPVY